MRRHQPVGGGQTGDDWNAQVEQGQLGFSRQREDNGNQQNHAHAEKHRQPDDEGDEHEGPMQTLFAKGGDEGLGHDLRAAGLRQQLAQHGAEPDHHGDEAQGAAHAFLKRLGDVEQAHAGAQADEQRGQHQCDEGVHFPPRHQKDEQPHGQRGAGEERGLRAQSEQRDHALVLDVRGTR